MTDRKRWFKVLEVQVAAAAAAVVVVVVVVAAVAAVAAVVVVVIVVVQRKTNKIVDMYALLSKGLFNPYGRLPVTAWISFLTHPSYFP